MKASGIGDTAFFGPEAEFFVFDDVRWSTEPNNTGYSFDSTELPFNTGRSYEGGNLGHRPGHGGTERGTHVWGPPEPKIGYLREHRPPHGRTRRERLDPPTRR